MASTLLLHSHLSRTPHWCTRAFAMSRRGVQNVLLHEYFFFCFIPTKSRHYPTLPFKSMNLRGANAAREGEGTCGEEEQKSAAAAAAGGGGAKTCGLFIARAHRILGSLKRPLPRQPLLCQISTGLVFRLPPEIAADRQSFPPSNET